MPFKVYSIVLLFNMNSKLSCGFCRKADIFGRKAAHLVKECHLLDRM